VETTLEATEERSSNAVVIKEPISAVEETTARSSHCVPSKKTSRKVCMPEEVDPEEVFAPFPIEFKEHVCVQKLCKC
jgi:hypothetical protein